MTENSNPGPATPHHLSHRHRQILTTLLDDADGANLHWTEAEALLAAAGRVEQRHDGRLAVTVGAETEIFERSRDHHVSDQQSVNLRRMLRNAGYTADA